MCCKILSLAHAFKETHQRKFNNNNFWDILSLTTTNLGKDSNETDSHLNVDTISKLTASIFDHNKKTESDYMIDHSLLDDNVMSALTGDLAADNINNDEDSPITIDSEDEIEEGDIDVNNEIGTKSTTIKKVNIHESAAVNILNKGIDNMKSKNLPVVRYKNNCQMKRKQVTLKDSIYANMINTNDNNLFNVIIGDINNEEDGIIFGTWDKEIRSLI